VAVWGPGTVGIAAIREILLLRETSLCGVLAYSDAKRGIDAGTLAGVDPVGVYATTDVDELVATNPECVIHAPRDLGDYRADEDLVLLLERGINVVSVLPYQYPFTRGGDAFAHLDEAAKRGGATLFATGINPGFLFERVVLTATGVCNDIRNISLSESINVEHISGGAEFLTVMGFGMEGADPQAVEAVAGTVSNYLTPYLYYAADQMGVEIDRLERDDEHVCTPVDIDIPDLFTLTAGTVALVRFRWTAYSDGRPVLSTQVNWYATDAMRPDEARGYGDDVWKIQIDGRPSLSLTAELTGTAAGDAVHPLNPAHPSMLGTAVPAIQAIRTVIDAPPGVLIIDPPQFHWKRDQRAVRTRSLATTSER
jgi:2,4-diaminopentanoate dehydrogenase